MKRFNHWFILIGVIVFIFITFPSFGIVSYESSLKNIEEKIYYYPSQAEKMLDSLLLQHSLGNEKKYNGELSFLKGFMEWHKGNMDNSINFLDSALISFIKQGNITGQANCYLLMGWISQYDNYLEQAKIYFYKTINILNNEPLANVGIAYINISLCKKQLKEPYKEDLNRGIKYLEHTGNIEFQLYGQYKRLEDNIKEPGSISLLNNIAEQYINIGINNGASSVYKSIAMYYYRIKPDSALIYLNKAIKIYDNKYPQASLMPSMHQLKGIVYRLQNDFKAARKEFMQSIDFYKKHDQLISSYYVYHSLYLLDKNEKNYESSLKNLVLADKYKEQYNIKQKQRMAKGLEISSHVSLLKDQIVKSKRQNQLLLFLLVMFCAVGAIVFLTVTLRIREKRNKIDKLKAEFHLAIVSYQDGLKTIKLIKEKEANQEEFISQYSSGKRLKEIYPGLYSLVCITFPTLRDSAWDYALMFAIGLPEEDICRFKNIQRSSIRKTKQRIRQELNLSKDEDINKYFQKKMNL